SAAQRAALRIDHDALPAADDRRPGIQHPDIVAAALQLVAHLLGHAALDGDLPAREGPEAGRFDGRLDAVAVVQDVGDHLHRRLKNTERTWRADQQEGLAVLIDDRRRHRRHAWRRWADRVGAVRIEVEEVAEVVQRNAGVTAHYTGTEKRTQALGDRDAVALTVDDVEMRRVLAGEVLRAAWAHRAFRQRSSVALAFDRPGALRVDLRPPRRRVFLREEA